MSPPLKGTLFSSVISPLYSGSAAIHEAVSKDALFVDGLFLILHVFNVHCFL